MLLASFVTHTNVRTTPSRTAQILKVTSPNDLAVVLGGAIGAGGLSWYPLQHKDGVRGYSAINDSISTLFTTFQTPEIFDRSLTFTLAHEGVYVNDPNDPGAETKYGISKAAHPLLDIAHLTLETAQLIYYADYWQPFDWKLAPWPKCCMLFDIAVMTGPGHASKLQGLDPIKIITAELNYLTGLDNFRLYGAGWTRRTADLLNLIQ